MTEDASMTGRPGPKIDVSVFCRLWEQALPNAQALSRNAAQAVLVEYGPDLTDVEASIVLADDAFVQGLNQDYRDRDRPTVGHIELEAQDPGEVVFRIPPRDRENFAEYSEFDPAGNFLGSFIFQTLNMLQKKELITLPGLLPTS